MDKTGIITFLLVVAGTCLIIPVMIKSAWLCDDAYITYRTVDNFTHGLGLTWNPGERVQAYTHPLWMFLLSFAYLFTNEIYYTSIFLSLTLSLSAIILFGWKLTGSPGEVIIGFSVLCMSKTFIDYTTSGLENPLTYLIIVLFLIVYLNNESLNEHLFVLSFIASLGALTRLDTILLYIPAIFYAYVKSKKRGAGAFSVFFGFFPLYLWTGFSLIYYGFPFPNTAYAKLNTGIDSLQFVEQGFWYLKHTYTHDPLSFFIIILGLMACIIHRKKRIFFASLGILLYITYVVKIGGDFMGGRFLAGPFFYSVILLCSTPADKTRIWVPALVFSLFFGLRIPRSPIFSDKSYRYSQCDEHDVADERGYYYKWTGLLRALDGKELPNHQWADEGRELRKSPKSTWVYACVGFVGYFAGPDIHFIDVHALTDPLLARMHTINTDKWKIGHFRRNIPEGYIATIWNKKNHLADKSLAAYYDKLALLTQGDIFSKERIKEIWNMNMGKYDYLLAKYRNEMIKIPVSLISSSGKANTARNTIIFSSHGIEINLGSRWTSSHLILGLKNNCPYEVEFRNFIFFCGKCRIEKKRENTGDHYLHTIKVPAAAMEKGFTHLRIIPLSSEDDFSIGYCTPQEKQLLSR